jgi:hypothetical protein
VSPIRRPRLAVNWLCAFLVAFSLGTFSLPATSFAAVGATPPAGMMDLVDLYVKELATASPDNMFGRIGKEEFLAKAVATQVATLEPEDFNVFLFYVMDRYIKNPGERKALFAFVQALRESVAADLANTAQIEQGPAHEMVTGAYTWGAWILIGGLIGWRVILASPLRTSTFMQKLQQQEMAIARAPRAYRLTYRITTNPLLWASAGGAGIGYFQYLLEKNRTHRLDPSRILNVVQAQLACQLSYQALDLEDRFEAARGDDERLRSAYPDLDAGITRTLEQARDLTDQFPRLDNLDVRDDLFQQDLRSLPMAKNFQDFRKDLSEADQAPDGRCRQMSLTHLILATEQLRDNLRTSYEILAPADVTPAPTQGAQP